MKDMQEKIRFFGRIVSVQPRANVWRYRLDNRSHGMKGYNLFLKGVADSEDKDFSYCHFREAAGKASLSLR